MVRCGADFLLRIQEACQMKMGVGKVGVKFERTAERGLRESPTN